MLGPLCSNDPIYLSTNICTILRDIYVCMCPGILHRMSWKLVAYKAS